MNKDFQSVLKTLGKQAKQAAEAKAEAEEAARKQAAQQVDFAKEMAGVTPLKNSNRYAPPRDASPIKPRQTQAEALAAEDYFYVGDGGADEPPATFSKNGQGKNDIRRLQSGHWPVVADVDLHGYTQEEAQQVLNEFIEFTKKTRRVRRNRPRQRFGFFGLQTRAEKSGAPLADGPSRRAGLCRTAPGQRRCG